jgi:hypothetical protein
MDWATQHTRSLVTSDPVWKVDAGYFDKNKAEKQKRLVR